MRVGDDHNLHEYSASDFLETLFRNYYSRLLYYSYQFVHDNEIGRDIVQDAFLNFWRLHAKDTVDTIQARNFLYVSVKNSCLKHIRHQQVVERYESSSEFQESEESITINKIIRAEVLGQIYEAISSLPESCQTISRMTYLEGMKNHEVAKILGISINTVKTQKQRALQLLRLRLDPNTFLSFCIIATAIDSPL